MFKTGTQCNNIDVNNNASSSFNDKRETADTSSLSVRLTDELLAIAQQLTALAVKTESAPAQQAALPGFMLQDTGQDNANMSLLTDRLSNWTISAADVRAEIARRRKRDSFFKNGMFADPAWDILLDLYAAQLEHKSVTVSSACIAAAVPQTTALRWIERLTRYGLIERKHDPLDRRKAYLTLTNNGTQAMSACLKAALFISAP